MRQRRSPSPVRSLSPGMHRRPVGQQAVGLLPPPQLGANPPVVPDTCNTAKDYASGGWTGLPLPQVTPPAQLSMHSTHENLSNQLPASMPGHPSGTFSPPLQQQQPVITLAAHLAGPRVSTAAGLGSARPENLALGPVKCASIMSSVGLTPSTLESAAPALSGLDLPWVPDSGSAAEIAAPSGSEAARKLCPKRGNTLSKKQSSRAAGVRQGSSDSKRRTTMAFQKLAHDAALEAVKVLLRPLFHSKRIDAAVYKAVAASATRVLFSDWRDHDGRKVAGEMKIALDNAFDSLTVAVIVSDALHEQGVEINVKEL